MNNTVNGEEIREQIIVVDISSSTLWILGMEFRSSGLETSPFTHWAISLAPELLFI